MTRMANKDYCSPVAEVLGVNPEDLLCQSAGRNGYGTADTQEWD